MDKQLSLVPNVAWPALLMRWAMGVKGTVTGILCYSVKDSEKLFIYLFIQKNSTSLKRTLTFLYQAWEFSSKQSHL